mgnify:FL=1
MDKTDKKLAKNMRPKKKKKRKFNKKYTKGSKNVKRREQLMARTAEIYETEEQPYRPAIKKELKKIMDERDRI